MIHGGLNIDLKMDNSLGYNQCCLSTVPLTFAKDDRVDWNSGVLSENRDAIADTPMIHTIGKDWKESPNWINQFLIETEKFDQLRGQDWKKTFLEVAEFYRRYF